MLRKDLKFGILCNELTVLWVVFHGARREIKDMCASPLAQALAEGTG